MEEAAMVIRQQMLQERLTLGTQAFAVGSYVRLAKKKQTLRKDRKQTFEVVTVIPKGNFFSFESCDLANNLIKGTLHEQKLSKSIMSQKPYHRIARVLKQRALKRNNTICYSMVWIQFSLWRR